MALSISALIFLTACHGGGHQAAASPTCIAAARDAADLGASAQGTAIVIEAKDDHFVPACVEVPVGQPVTLVVRNGGSHPHNLTLPDGKAVAVDAGGVALLDVPVGPGGVRYSCTIHPGMKAELRAVP